jgi:tricorn protease-like protein
MQRLKGLAPEERLKGLAPEERLKDLTEVEQVLAGHSDRGTAVAVTADGRYAVSGSADETLKVWELETGREVRALAGHLYWVMAVEMTPDGRYAVSGSNDKTLRVWELETGREARALARHSDCVRAVAVTQDGRYAVSGSDDRTLRVWELETGLSPIIFHGDEPFLSVAVALDGRTVIAGDHAGRVHFLSLEGLPQHSRANGASRPSSSA